MEAHRAARVACSFELHPVLNEQRLWRAPWLRNHPCVGRSHHGGGDHVNDANIGQNQLHALRRVVVLQFLHHFPS